MKFHNYILYCNSIPEAYLNEICLDRVASWKSFFRFKEKIWMPTKKILKESTFVNDMAVLIWNHDFFLFLKKFLSFVKEMHYLRLKWTNSLPDEQIDSFVLYIFPQNKEFYITWFKAFETAYELQCSITKVIWRILTSSVRLYFRNLLWF